MTDNKKNTLIARLSSLLEKLRGKQRPKVVEEEEKDDGAITNSGSTITTNSGNSITQNITQNIIITDSSTRSAMLRRYNNQQEWAAALNKHYPDSRIPGFSVGLDLLRAAPSGFEETDRPLRLYGSDLKQRREDALIDAQKAAEYGDYLLSFFRNSSNIREFHIFMDVFKLPNEIEEFFKSALDHLSAGKYSSKYETSSVYYSRTERIVFDRNSERHPQNPWHKKNLPTILALDSVALKEPFLEDSITLGSSAKNVDYLRDRPTYLKNTEHIEEFVNANFLRKKPTSIYLGGLDLKTYAPSVAQTGSRTQIFIYDKSSKEKDDPRYKDFLRIEFRFSMKPSDFKSNPQQIGPALRVIHLMQEMLDMAIEKKLPYTALIPDSQRLKNELLTILERSISFKQPPRLLKDQKGPRMRDFSSARVRRWKPAVFWERLLWELRLPGYETIPDIHDDIFTILNTRSSGPKNE
jgi:hypothetical protein